MFSQANCIINEQVDSRLSSFTAGVAAEDNTMGDNQQLLNLLSLPNVLLDPAKQQQAVNQLCRLMNTDCDEAQIVQPCIKLLSSHQPLTRIVVMQLVQRHVARNPDIMPQATNALLKCAVDPNPAVRRAAVSTLARVPDSGEVTGPVVAAALRDPHPAVQRAAAVACRVLPRSNPDCHIDHVDELYRLIRSDDALLVHACLTSLDVILAAEGGIVISRAMVRHLSSRSRSLPDFVLVDVLRLLARYQPTSDEERLTLMNRLDWTLASPAPHLVEAALELFFHLCSEGQLRHLRADAVRRAAAALCSPPAAQGAEVRWAVLQLVSELGTEHHAAFSQHYRYFVPRPSDGPALSMQLVQFLWRLAVADTPDSVAAAPSVIRELSVCVSSPRLQTAAAESLLRVAAHRPALAEATLEPLVRVVRSGQAGAAAVAGVLTPADLSPLPPGARKRLLETLLSADLTALPAQPLCRLLKALGLYGSAIPTAAALLRRLALGGGGGASDRCEAPGSDALSCGGGGSVLGSDAVSNDTGSGSVLYGGKGSNIDTYGDAYSSGDGTGGSGAALNDLSVRLALLESTARLFIRRPAELQLTLGLLLERAVTAGGELAATAARLYAALELSGGTDLMDGTEADDRETIQDGAQETTGNTETDGGSQKSAGSGTRESARRQDGATSYGEWGAGTGGESVI